jgi:ribosomal protein S18 acetylase RimI-like enzyme
MSIQYTQVSQDAEIQQILDLQQVNLPKNISKEEAISQGFVTVEHTFSLLKRMNDLAPSTIAKDGEKVIGYCLSMLAELKNDVPVLVPMFEMIEKIDYQGKKLSDSPYVIMGQVCVDKNYRGLGVFDGMYQAMRSYFENQFDKVITEVALRNTRSMKAHQRVGFQNIHEYATPNGEHWAIVVWDWRK